MYLLFELEEREEDKLELIDISQVATGLTQNSNGLSKFTAKRGVTSRKFTIHESSVLMTLAAVINSGFKIASVAEREITRIVIP